MIKSAKLIASASVVKIVAIAAAT